MFLHCFLYNIVCFRIQVYNDLVNCWTRKDLYSLWSVSVNLTKGPRSQCLYNPPVRHCRADTMLGRHYSTLIVGQAAPWLAVHSWRGTPLYLQLHRIVKHLFEWHSLEVFVIYLSLFVDILECVVSSDGCGGDVVGVGGWCGGRWGREKCGGESHPTSLICGGKVCFGSCHSAQISSFV